VTMPFALEVQVGRDPGAPGAIRVGMTRSFCIDHAREELPLPPLLIAALTTVAQPRSCRRYLSGPFVFLLQDYFVQEWADSFVDAYDGHQSGSIVGNHFQARSGVPL